MKKQMIVFLLFMMTAVSLYAITGEEILRNVDANTKFNSIEYTGSMEIHLGDEVRVKKMKAWAVKDQKAYVEFLNKEDQNIRYLKLNKQLWLYDADEENSFLISGHLLKKGMMGSDFSYEDALESDELYQKYDITLSGEEKLDGKDCYVVVLNARVKDAPYAQRKMWVDKKLFVGLKEELYAKSGKLLKVSRVLEVKNIRGRNFAVKSEMVNKLRKNSKTVMILDKVALGKPIPASYFTKRHLER